MSSKASLLFLGLLVGAASLTASVASANSLGSAGGINGRTDGIVHKTATSAAAQQKAAQQKKAAALKKKQQQQKAAAAAAAKAKQEQQKKEWYEDDRDRYNEPSPRTPEVDTCDWPDCAEPVSGSFAGAAGAGVFCRAHMRERTRQQIALMAAKQRGEVA